MGTNQYYYNKGVEITSKEAHELKDKSGLVVADRPINFDTEFKGTKRGLAKDYSAELDKEAV